MLSLFSLLIAAFLVPEAAEPLQPVSPVTTNRYDVTFTFLPGSERRPVTYDRQSGLLVFRAQVQGHEVWAILDNGTQTSTIDVNLAREVGLQPGPPIGQLVAGSGSIERRRVFGVDVTIPGQVRYRTPMSAVDLAQVSRAVGRPIGLIIGREIFKNMTFVIYPGRGTFQLGLSGNVGVPETVPYLSLLDDDAHTVATIGNRSLTLMVDLGYNGQIALSPDAWTRARLDPLPYEVEFGVDMTSNRVEQRRARVPQITVGPISRADVGTVRMPMAANNRDGLIGFGFLSGFDFAIDVRTRRLWLLRDLSGTSRVSTPPPPAH